MVLMELWRRAKSKLLMDLTVIVLQHDILCCYFPIQLGINSESLKIFVMCY